MESVRSTSQSPPLTLPGEDDMRPYAVEPPRSPSHGQFRLPHPPGMPACVPPLPPAWEGTERMSEWLKAKAEEDKRRQEEEKTRQANLLLEQRRVEQAILQDSLRAGVPAHLIPMIFNGMHKSGANPQLATELQRQWSAPRVTAPQQPTRQPYPTSLPVQPNPLYQPPPQPGPQQPPQIPNAFENTFPVISSLNQAARSQAQSTMPRSSKDGGERKKTVEYHFYNPPKMNSPHVQQQQPQQPQFKLPPLPPPKVQARPESSTSNDSDTKVYSFPQEKSISKRKNKKSHEKLPPPQSRPQTQGQAADAHEDQPRSTPMIQKSTASDLSNQPDSDVWEEKSTREAMNAVLNALDRQRGTRPDHSALAAATSQSDETEIKAEDLAGPQTKSD
ncbi:hypothetical protein MYU51_009335 [Penicillium brevicompactum]